VIDRKLCFRFVPRNRAGADLCTDDIIQARWGETAEGQRINALLEQSAADQGPKTASTGTPEGDEAKKPPRPRFRQRRVGSASQKPVIPKLSLRSRRVRPAIPARVTPATGVAAALAIGTQA
ncbi:MAG: hypothetical protein HQ558_02870, partial [Candidatus Omnitrophica bacterium]|nr:hypothetical protein [Candidatus Omnitrophota bacterium]